MPVVVPPLTRHARRTRRRRRLLRIALLLLAFNLVIPPYVRPAQGAVTSRYFLRTRPERMNPLALEVHKGIDFAAPLGSPVRAAKSGIVDTVGTSPTLGTYIIIRHWLGFSTLYAHLDVRAHAPRPAGREVGAHRVGRTERAGHRSPPALRGALARPAAAAGSVPGHRQRPHRPLAAHSPCLTRVELWSNEQATR